MRLLLLLLVLTAYSFVGSQSLAADSTLATDSFDHELDYVAALRDQTFYDLATKQGEKLLARSDLETDQRIQATVEHSKSYAALALNSRGAQRDQYWSQASVVLEEALRSAPNEATKFILQTQQAFTAEQRAEWTVREAEIRSRTDADWAESRSQLRAAIKLLKELKRQATSPVLRRRFADKTDRIQELRRNLDYQLARAYLHQAIAYDNRMSDRTNALTQSLALFKSLAAGRERDELVWKSRIDQIRCVRLLGQFNQARSLMQKSSDLPAEYLGPLAAESVRLALDAKQLDSALAIATNSRVQSNAPEFHLARAETLVAAAEQLRGTPNGKRYEQQAAEVAAAMGQQFGVYWALRAEILLSQFATSGNADADSLENAANTMLRRDSPEEAKELLLRAADEADRSGNNKAFDYAFNAAVVDRREGKLESAIEQFHQLAAKYPKHPRAAEAHLLAVFDSASLYQQYAAAKSSKMALALNQYEQFLSEHIHAWPESETADQARMWSAKLMTARRKWIDAISLYQSVNVGSKFERNAYKEMGLLFDDWLATSRSNEQLATQRNWMDARMNQVTDRAARTILAATLARLTMFWEPRDYETAERTVVDALGGATPEARPELAALRVLARAGNKNAVQAQLDFSRSAPWEAKMLLLMLHNLAPIRDRAPNDVALQRLTREIVQRAKAKSSSLSEKDQLAIQLAISDYAPVEQAVVSYQSLAGKHTNDMRIQARYAELLSANKRHEEALIQWRKVVAQSKKRSATWFRAKLGIAKALVASGNKQQARELIEYMQAIYPDMGGATLQRQFKNVLGTAK